MRTNSHPAPQCNPNQSHLNFNRGIARNALGRALVSTCLCGFVWLAPLSPAQTPNVQSSGTNQTQQLFNPAATVRVTGFKFRGQTVFSTNQLADVVASFQNRPVTFEELEEARQVLSRFYVEHGFINSGAIFEDDFYEAGIVTFKIIEGELDQIEVTGTRWLRKNYVASRVRRGAGKPLNVNRLQSALLQLRENPNIRQINTELEPGLTLGSAKARVRVAETKPWEFAIEVRNDRPPSVGGESVEAHLSHANLTGQSDLFSLRYGIAAARQKGFEFTGLDDYGVSYNLPVTPFETSLFLGYDQKSYAIIEEPFNSLDIASKSDTYRAGVRQPLYRTLTRELALALSLERQHSESTLLGLPFSLSAGAVNGQSTVTALRFSQDFTDRGLQHSVALRSAWSFGLDALNSTVSDLGRDSRYWTWNGQVQYARRLFESGAQVFLRAAAQLSPEDLPALEQFPIGGLSTVRGYRENELLRDIGVLASAELRVPVWSDKKGAPLISLAPFFDFGGGWNNKMATPPVTTLSSAGAGLLLTPWRFFNSQIYWGHPFRDLHHDNGDLQDDGIHVAARLAWKF